MNAFYTNSIKNLTSAVKQHEDALKKIEKTLDDGMSTPSLSQLPWEYAILDNIDEEDVQYSEDIFLEENAILEIGDVINVQSVADNSDEITLRQVKIIVDAEGVGYKAEDLAVLSTASQIIDKEDYLKSVIAKKKGYHNDSSVGPKVVHFTFKATVTGKEKYALYSSPIVVKYRIHKLD